MAADRFSINKSWDHIQSKFVGTGHSDISKFEWASNQHRDTIASHIGHHDMLCFFAVAQNDAVGRVRYQLLEVRKIDVYSQYFQLLLVPENASALWTSSCTRRRGVIIRS